MCLIPLKQITPVIDGIIPSLWRYYSQLMAIKGLNYSKENGRSALSRPVLKSSMGRGIPKIKLGMYSESVGDKVFKRKTYTAPTGEYKEKKRGGGMYAVHKRKITKENVRVRLRPYAYAAICVCFHVRMSVCVFSMRVRLCVHVTVCVYKEKNKKCAAKKRKTPSTGMKNPAYWHEEPRVLA
ncbi:MAG: hypothetical protein GY820_24220 [Gammaproteobacteria bacterium]|nr:hypothetical protein [Gammaproteobacteria bacterium]